MNTEALSQEFENRRFRYEQLMTEALFILEQALKATDIKLHSTASRIKKLDSFLDKVNRKQLNSPFDEIQDIVGIRVVCLFLSDVERIGEVIGNVFTVLSEDNRIEGSEVSSFGYMSVHFIAQMKEEYTGPRYTPIAKIPFEIQVRTIAMDAWANVSHHLDYRSDLDVPKDLRRDFYALSGLFYVADRHFEMFFRSSSESREKMVEAFSGATIPANQELNLDSLTAFLLNKFPDRKHSDSANLSGLLGELLEAGIESIDTIDDAINISLEACNAYEAASPPFGEPGRKYADVGIVRAALELTNDKFFNLRLRKGQTTPARNFKHLLKRRQ